MVTVVPQRMTFRTLARTFTNLRKMHEPIYIFWTYGHMLYSILLSCPDFLLWYVCFGREVLQVLHVLKLVMLVQQLKHIQNTWKARLISKLPSCSRPHQFLKTIFRSQEDTKPTVSNFVFTPQPLPQLNKTYHCTKYEVSQ